MGQLTAGEVIAVNFPFSNLRESKLRPALVLAKVEFDNVILCQVTSRSYSSSSAIRLEKTDFAEGQLPLISYARPDKLFTADPSIITATVGRLTATKKDQILGSVRQIFR